MCEQCEQAGDPEQLKEARFVSNMVDVFIKRHTVKLHEATPLMDEEKIIRGSGIKGLSEMMDVVEHASAKIGKAQEAYNQVRISFDAAYGEAIKELLDAASRQYVATLAEKSQDFEFRIRKAIGEVELVNGHAAFLTLDACRNEINEMGK